MDPLERNIDPNYNVTPYLYRCVVSKLGKIYKTVDCS